MPTTTKAGRLIKTLVFLAIIVGISSAHAEYYFVPTPTFPCSKCTAVHVKKIKIYHHHKKHHAARNHCMVHHYPKKRNYYRITTTYVWHTIPGCPEGDIITTAPPCRFCNETVYRNINTEEDEKDFDMDRRTADDIYPELQINN